MVLNFQLLISSLEKTDRLTLIEGPSNSKKESMIPMSSMTLCSATQLVKILKTMLLMLMKHLTYSKLQPKLLESSLDNPFTLKLREEDSFNTGQVLWKKRRKI